MISMQFDCWMNWGKGDSTDWEIEVDVTEEEYERLKEVAVEGLEFDEAESVKDIYNRVYKLIVDEATVNLLEEDPDLAEEYEDEEEWSADELYSFGVNIPEWFYDEVCDEDSEDE